MAGGSPARPGPPRLLTGVLVLLSVVTAVLVVALVVAGWQYYSTPLLERPHHADHRLWRSAGDLGHGLGVAGSACLLLLLLYSVRKRLVVDPRWGPLPVWLRFHIYLGITGPLLITLHSSLKIEGLVAVSYWSMAAVAVSGVLGRYLYQQIPRNVFGEALDFDDVMERRDALDNQLQSVSGQDSDLLTELARVAGSPDPTAAAGDGSFRLLLQLPWRNLTLRRDLKGLLQRPQPPSDPTTFLRLARQRVQLERRLLVFHTVRDLFHHWHVVHKPFAYLMLIIMAIHIAVTVMFGYRWVF
ncbi:MAG: hypothetical protein ABIF77_21845 [bacterium]